MGQYFVVANLDSREYISPFSLNSGSKALEQVGDWIGVPHAVMLLLGSGMGRGGGDFDVPRNSHADTVISALNQGRLDDAARIASDAAAEVDRDEVLGRWAGQRLCFVGDYYEPGDVAGIDDPDIYGTITTSFTDIGHLLPPYLAGNFPQR